jgi:NADH dehydrogenase FAD-containing subunit
MRRAPRTARGAAPYACVTQAQGAALQGRIGLAAANQGELAMTNIKAEVKGNVLHLTIDLKAKGTPSASGKSQVIATTSGNVSVDGTEFKLGLNLYKSLK